MTSSVHMATLRLPPWFTAVALLLASWIVILCLTLQVRPGAEAVATAFPPWWSAPQTILASAAAEADIVRETAIPTVLIVRPGSRDGIARLRQSGAWLVFDPQAIAACLNINSTRM